MEEQKPAKNTDMELFRENRQDPLDPDNHYSPSLFVTKEGLIGMDVGGSVFVMTITEWHKLADSNVARDYIPENSGRSIFERKVFRAVIQKIVDRWANEIPHFMWGRIALLAAEAALEVIMAEPLMIEQDQIKFVDIDLKKLWAKEK